MDFIGQLLINIFNSQNRLRENVKNFHVFLNSMNKSGLKISPAAATTIQNLLPQNIEEKDLTSIRQTLKHMQSRNLVLSNSDGTVNSNNSLSNSSTFIKHPRDMSLEELECHLIELESKGMNARGILRRLLQLYVRNNRLEKALEVNKKCEEQKVQVSPGMCASILDMHIKLKDLPKAQETLKRIQQLYPGFQIDEHKIIDYAALLVHEDKLNEAKQLLTNYAATRQVVGGDYVLKNVWNLLTTVAHTAATKSKATKTPVDSHQNVTHDTFVFLSELGYCKSHNTVLGPIVRECLLRGDIRGAVDEFRKLVEHYKHTPLQYELLVLLVRLCNENPADVQHYNVSSDEAQRLLNVVTETITKVHGAVNMNSGLLLAFAEAGTDKQLRRLLMNPEFRINQELLVKNCEHLGQEGAIQTLLHLARNARGLSHLIDEQFIYDLLLKNFTITNNCEAALSLFDKLEGDDDLKLTQQFLRNLVNLLNANNVDIPSNVALRAQIIVN